MITVLIPNRGFILDKTINGVIDSFKETGYDWKLMTTPDLPNPEGRNYLVDEALKLKPEFVLFIDDDVVLRPEILKAMVEKDKDIVVCPYSVDPAGGNDYHCDENGEILRAGLGCALIKPKVFSKLEKPYFRTNKTFLRFGGGRDLVVKDNPNSTWGGEDTYFFYMAREAGFKIHKVPFEADHLRIITWGDKFNNIGNHRIRKITDTDLRIGAWFHFYPPYHNAGAEHMAHSIFKRFADKYDIAVYSGLSEESNYLLDGVKVFNRPEILANYDILFTHLDETPNAEKFAWEHNQPLVHFIHNDTQPNWIKKCDLAVFNSNWIRDMWADKLEDKFYCESIVVHPPIWEEDYKVEQTGDCITLINMFQNKGPELVYEMARMMPNKKFLVVLGSYGEQIYPPKDLQNVEVMKNQKDAREIYKRTKVLLMPSVYETFGRTALEAGLNGIPTIANDTPGLKEALGEYGIFPRELDAHIWVEKLKEVLDPNNYIKYSERAREAIKQFDFKKEINVLEEKIKCL